MARMETCSRASEQRRKGGNTQQSLSMRLCGSQKESDMSQVIASPPGTGGGDFALEPRSVDGYS